MRVAIVGAGSAGMAMAKQLIDIAGPVASFVLFERRAEVGGIWQLDAQVEDPYLAWESNDASLHNVAETNSGQSPTPQHTSLQHRRLRIGWHDAWPPGPMFQGLRTNIPCDLMTYRDAPFPTSTSLYPSRETVQDYLTAYATKYDLRRHVRFNTSITRIAKDAHDDGWTVESSAVPSDKSPQSSPACVEHFTHVVLAHGRCQTPNIPNIEGTETFTGRIIHSAWYRDPSTLLRPGETRRVLVVGNASSGMDVARELCGFAARTLPNGLSPEEWAAEWQAKPIEVLSSWHASDKPPPMDYNPQDPDSPAWCKRIRVVDRIARIDGAYIHLDDGSVLSDVPLIIFATGFLFDNPFIDQSAGVLRRYPLLPPSTTSATRAGFPSASVYNLDDWLLLHAHDETLAMLGLPVTVVPFPFTEIQACYLVHRWLGKAPKLPLLNRELPPHDENRWASSRQDEQTREHGDSSNDDGDVVLNTTTHVFGKPSDTIYLDTLLSLLHNADPSAGIPVPWLDRYTSDGRGSGEPRGPEARYATAPWRTERRNAGRQLRRETLGY